MKTRLIIYALIFGLVILAVIFGRRPIQSPVTVEQPQATVQVINTPASNTNNARNNTSAVMPLATSSPASPTLTVSAKQLRTPEGFQKYIEGHNVPIDFFGQFIDQDSNVLSGVDIKVVVRHWTIAEPGTKDITLAQKSGTDGRFELTGASGDVFSIESIQKDGYESEPGQRTYGAGRGDFDNPVIFKMWSTNIHEKLIGGENAFDIVPDGRPYFINLTDGTISESSNGDLKVWIQYTNQTIRGQLYDWSAQIDVIDGGLLGRPLGSAMYEAPADGYVSSFQSKQQIKGGQRGQIGDHQFYLRLRNGQEYGRMSINLHAPFNNQTPGLVRLSYAINPSGSRILR